MNEKLQELRIEAFNHIADILKKKGITKIEVNEINGVDAPVLQWGDADENTYTLDRVIINFGRLTFEGSSSWDNIELTESTISTDSLVEIEEWLTDYEDDINGDEGLTDEQKDDICSKVDEYLSSIFEDDTDRRTILDSIIKEVYGYIETADWSGYEKNEYCIDDIHTAVQDILYDRIV